MEITKYEHACFSVEKNNKILVIDPGNLTTDFIVPEHIIGIVITHEHADHFDPDMLAAIYNKNPDSLLLADQAIIDKMPDHKSQAVLPGEHITIGPFDLTFYGGQHAVIHSSIPRITNIGVMINDLLYYPGDSLVVPEAGVDTLALPVSAPWLKDIEVINFLTTVKPRMAFPTHDANLSDSDKRIIDNLLGSTAQTQATTYQRLTGSIHL